MIRFLFCVAVLFSCAAMAAGPNDAAEYEGTIKESLGIPRDFFGRQRAISESRRAAWLEMAEKSRPKRCGRCATTGAAW